MSSVVKSRRLKQLETPAQIIPLRKIRYLTPEKSNNDRTQLVIRIFRHDTSLGCISSLCDQQKT